MSRFAARAPFLGALLLLGACVATPPVDSQTGFLDELPPRLVALAAPYQDLSAVRLNRADGCYWYRYSGPVETTMLPVRTADGQRVCVR